MIGIRLPVFRCRAKRKLGAKGLVAIEVKRSGRFREEDLGGLREFLADYPIARAYLLHGGAQRLKFGAIEVLPLAEALKDCVTLIETKSKPQKKPRRR
jgi:hypothetical protein